MPNDDYMLTTLDNPYDPFEDFTSWFLYDTEKGYNTCGLLARIVKEDESFSEKETNAAIDAAMDFIVKNDPLQNYVKVPPKFIKPIEKPS